MNGKELILDCALGLVFGIIVGGVLFLISLPIKFPTDTLAIIIISTILFCLTEEVSKFVPLKLNLFKTNHIWIGLFVGFGFAMLENFTYLYNRNAVLHNRIPSTILHIITGMIMGYFVSKKKSWIGLLLAIILHCAFNFYLTFS